MFTPEEIEELRCISNLPNIYKFIAKFSMVSHPLREVYAKNKRKAVWMETRDLSEMYQGFRDSLIKKSMTLSPHDETELVMLLKLAMVELNSPCNTRWYSSMSPLLLCYVLDNNIPTSRVQRVR